MKSGDEFVENTENMGKDLQKMRMRDANAMTREKLNSMSLAKFLNQYQEYVNKILIQGCSPFIQQKFQQFLNTSKQSDPKDQLFQRLHRRRTVQH